MTITSIDPSSAGKLRDHRLHDAAAVDALLEKATRAQRELAGLSMDERATLLLAAADVMESRGERLAEIMTQEMGKTLANARGEVAKCVKSMRFYAEQAPRFLADERPTEPSSVGAADAFVTYQPLGLVLAVMPWNYPSWQVIRFAAPALMAGNGCVLKHASNVPQTAVELEQVFVDAGYPDGSFVTLLIKSADVAAVIADERIAAVTLTGSEGAGQAVAEVAGRSLKKTVLELGGTDPLIVLPTADISRAAELAVQSRMQNNGQSCICAKRFIVHDDVYDSFVEEFKKRTLDLVVGDPKEPGTDIGPIATKSGLEGIRELVDDARAKGAEVTSAPNVPSNDGYWYAPTIVEGVTKEMRLWGEEAFGPVAAVFRVPDFEEAIALANDSSLGLSSSVWTNDQDEQKQAVASIQAGAVFVNGISASFPELPFGGIKRSGYGRELAANGIREFCNIKTVWKA
jgi:succinate-semialdehyde dehydrogenase/glutarate-semialdehyde dehydrogenase